MSGVPAPASPAPIASVVVGKSAIAFGLPDAKPQAATKKPDVTVTFAKPADAANLPAIVASNTFQNWAEQYVASNLVMESMDVLEFDLNGTCLKSVKIDAKIVDKQGLPVGGRIDLIQPKCAVVIMLRNMSTQRDLVLFTVSPRPSLCEAEHFGIPVGNFDEEGQFVCDVTDTIEKQCGLQLNIEEMENLSAIVFGKAKKGISLSSDPQCSDNCQVFLYRRNLSPEAIEKIQEQSSGGNSDQPEESEAAPESKTDEDSQTNNFRLLPLGDAWRTTSDARSMAALFLVLELRYHNMMPKFRAPRPFFESKSKATFVTVASLKPDSHGFNLVAKVQKAAEVDSESVKTDGSKIKEGIAVLGDATGTIKMKLTTDQLELLQEEGEVKVIRNGKIEMVKGRMVVVVDRWGKICAADTLEGDHDTTFGVLPDNDMSGVEHEIVLYADRVNPKLVEGEDSRTSRGRGRGRGRNGGRGQGGPRGAAMRPSNWPPAA